MDMTFEMDLDEYGEVLSTPKTVSRIGHVLIISGSLIIGWTDEMGTHMDILFVLKPIQVGNLQRGMNARTDLFVAVSHFGMFGFDIDISEPSHHAYVAEKLNLNPNDATTKKLAQLINDIRMELNGRRK